MSLDDRRNQIERVVESLAHAHNADVFLLAGDITPGLGHDFIELCPSPTTNAENCIVFLTTAGGSFEAGYRITRCIQSRYAKGSFLLFTDGICKSTGTLIAMGADALVMTDHAELGPLDTQLMVRDEFGEYESSLIDIDALRSLENAVFSTFRGHLDSLLSLGTSSLTTQTALRTAAELTLGLFGGIYGQIDPRRLGERERAIQLALEYGQRVSTSNVKEGTLRKLTIGYPSHGFQIDRREAGDLFYDVYVPDEPMALLANLLRPAVDLALEYGGLLQEHLNLGISEELGRMIQIADSNVPTNPPSEGDEQRESAEDTNSADSGAAAN